MEKMARGIRKQRQLQAEKQRFDAGQSFERLLNIQTKAGTDALTQSMLLACGKQDGLLNTQTVNEFC